VASPAKYVKRVKLWRGKLETGAGCGGQCSEWLFVIKQNGVFNIVH